MKKWLLAVPLAALVAFTVPKWNIKSDTSEVKFKIKNFGVWVEGSLSGLTGSIQFDPKDLAGSSITGSVDVSTINTGIDGRDSHLKKAEYFDAATYPKITIKSKSISKDGDNYKMDASLTIKATTKSISLPFTFTEADGKKGLFKAELEIDRAEYGVGESGGAMGTAVKITIFVPVYQ